MREREREQKKKTTTESQPFVSGAEGSLSQTSRAPGKGGHRCACLGATCRRFPMGVPLGCSHHSHKALDFKRLLDFREGDGCDSVPTPKSRAFRHSGGGGAFRLRISTALRCSGRGFKGSSWAHHGLIISSCQAFEKKVLRLRTLHERWRGAPNTSNIPTLREIIQIILEAQSGAPTKQNSNSAECWPPRLLRTRSTKKPRAVS